MWHARRHADRAAPRREGERPAARAARRDRDERRGVAAGRAARLRGEREVWRSTCPGFGGSAALPGRRAARDRGAHRRRERVHRRRPGSSARTWPATRSAAPWGSSSAGAARVASVTAISPAGFASRPGAALRRPSLRLTYWAGAAGCGRSRRGSSRARGCGGCSTAQMFAHPERLTPGEAYDAPRHDARRRAAFHDDADRARRPPLRGRDRRAGRRSPGARATRCCCRPRRCARAGCCPSARHVWLHGCGHVPMSDDPEQVARLLLAGSAGAGRAQNAVASASG